MLSLSTEALPAALEWGQVLVSIRAAPINPADLYTNQTGGLYGSEAANTPFVAGHDGVAVVVKVGGAWSGQQAAAAPRLLPAGVLAQLGTAAGQGFFRSSTD